MKAKLARNQNPTSRTDPELITTDPDGRRYIAKGTVIDHPKAYMLVMAGSALPEDEECLAELDARGWGPDTFDAKWNAQSAWLDKAEAGIRRAMIAPPPQQTDEATDDAGNTDG